MPVQEGETKEEIRFFSSFTLLWWVKYCDIINITGFFKEFAFGKKTVFLLEIGEKICIFNEVFYFLYQDNGKMA